MVWYDGNNNLFKLNFSSLKIYQIIKKKISRTRAMLILIDNKFRFFCTSAKNSIEKTLTSVVRSIKNQFK